MSDVDQMSDLVARLRGMAGGNEAHYCNEAADTIEWLTRERDAAVALLKEALAAIEEIHTDECSAWCGYRELRARIGALTSSVPSPISSPEAPSLPEKPAAPPES